MNLNLVPANPDFAEIFLKYRKDPETQKYNPLPPADLSALRERLAISSSDLSKLFEVETFFWFIERESKIIGNVTLQNINKMMLTAEVGYGIMAEARGQGIATAAVSELTKRVFEQTALRKLIAFVHAEN